MVENNKKTDEIKNKVIVSDKRMADGINKNVDAKQRTDERGKKGIADRKKTVVNLKREIVASDEKVTKPIGKLNIVFGVFVFIAAIGIVISVVQSMSLHSADPLANTFKQFFHLIAINVTWALVGVLLIFAAAASSVNNRPTASQNVCMFTLYAIAIVFCVAICSMLALGRMSDRMQVLALIALAVLPIAFASIATAIYSGMIVPSCAIQLVLLGVPLLFGGFISAPEITRVVFPSLYRPKLTVKDIFYPAIMIHDSTSWEVVANPEYLQTMSSNRFINRVNDPILIDSNFTVFQLADLSMKRNNRELLVTGPTMVEVTFNLKIDSNEKTPEHARELILQCKNLSSDPELDRRIRFKLGRAKTMQEMLTILQP